MHCAPATPFRVTRPWSRRLKHRPSRSRRSRARGAAAHTVLPTLPAPGPRSRRRPREPGTAHGRSAWLGRTVGGGLRRLGGSCVGDRGGVRVVQRAGHRCAVLQQQRPPRRRSGSHGRSHRPCCRCRPWASGSAGRGQSPRSSPHVGVAHALKGWPGPVSMCSWCCGAFPFRSPARHPRHAPRPLPCGPVAVTRRCDRSRTFRRSRM